MIQKCQFNTDWAIIRSALHLLSKIRFQKSKHHLFEMVPNFGFFWQKKGDIIGPGPGQNEIQIPQKNLSNQGLTLFPSSAYYWFLMRYPKENDLYGYPLKLY